MDEIVSRLVIRRARSADRESLIALISDSFQQEFELSYATPRSMRSYLASASLTFSPSVAWLSRLLGELAEFWVAELDREIVGVYHLSGSNPYAISSVAVRADLRGHGVGRAIMRHAFDRAAHLGSRQVVLEVLAHNAPAVRLYQSLGMSIYDTRPSYTKTLTAEDEQAPREPELRLRGYIRYSRQLWQRAFEASMPPEAHVFEKLYRAEYVSSVLIRQLEISLLEYGTLRSIAMVNDVPVGFACIRRYEMRGLVEVLPPVLMSDAQPYHLAVLRSCTAVAAREGATHARVYLPWYARDEGFKLGRMGYTPGQEWLYMYKNL